MAKRCTDRQTDRQKQTDHNNPLLSSSVKYTKDIRVGRFFQGGSFCYFFSFFSPPRKNRFYPLLLDKTGKKTFLNFQVKSSKSCQNFFVPDFVTYYKKKKVQYHNCLFLENYTVINLFYTYNFHAIHFSIKQ